MIGSEKILAVVPARGGSKGLLRKNITELCGRPLIAWTLDAAKDSSLLDRCIVSTDCEEIREIAIRYGADAPFLRPSELASDDTPGIEPVLHACEEVPGYSMVVMLQPTSPLRNAADIDDCIRKLVDQDADFSVSVTEPKHHPNWLYVPSGTGLIRRYDKEQLITRRQDLPPVYALNGAVYVARKDPLFVHRTFLGPNLVPHLMPPQRSIDIDSSVDLFLCEALLSEK